MSDAREALVALILERFRAAETYMDLPRQAGLLADATLAAVDQGVTARRPGCCQGWEWTPSGVVDALSGVERFDQEPCRHNHSAVVRPSEKGQVDDR